MSEESEQAAIAEKISKMSRIEMARTIITFAIEIADLKQKLEHAEKMVFGGMKE